MDSAICYFYYKDSPSMKLSKAISPFDSVELEMPRSTNAAITILRCLFEAAIPNRFFIFAELASLDRYSIEVCAKNGSRVLRTTGEIKALSRAMTEHGLPHVINETPHMNTANNVFFFALNRAIECGSPTQITLINMPSLKNIPEPGFDAFARFMHNFIEGERRYLNRIFLKKYY